MNINIFCRLRSSNRIDASSKIDIDRDNTIISRVNGPSFKFNKIFKDGDDINSVHNTCVTGLINGVINGFNSSLLLFGETGSGKSFMLAGNDNNRFGLFAATMRDIFSNLDTDERFRSSYKVYLRMFEVYDDVLVDLIKPNNSSKFSADTVVYSRGQGFQIKDITEVDIGSAAQAVVLFRDSWGRRIIYGKSEPDLQVATIVQIKLLLKNYDENAKDTVSQMSYVYFPGDESLIKTSSDNGGKKKKNGIFAVGNVLDDLNDPTVTSPNYSQSLLTTLLEDELGGNCITHALLCLSSSSNTDVLAAQLRTMNHLDKAKTCPIINTQYARNLLHGFRLQRKELLFVLMKDMNMKPDFSILSQGAIFENLKVTQLENGELRDKCETLQSRIDKLQNKYSHAMMDKSNLSEDFIQSEEEKLRASKKIMDLEIENNKSKEKMETIKFELSNKILYLEEKLANMELEKAFYIEDGKAFKSVNAERNELNKRFLILQKSYEDLKNETGLIVSKNKEMNLEFINMLKMKPNVTKMDLEANNGIIPMTDIYQIDNDRGVLRLNQNRRPLSNISSQEDKTLKLRLGKLQDELQKTRQIAQERLQQISKSSVDLIVLKDENHRLNMRIKDDTKTINTIMDEYRHRLRKYANKLSSLLDGSSTNEKQYKDEITKILKRYDSSYNISENHIKNLLKDTRKQLESLRGWSERIVYEYIRIRRQICDGGYSNVDLGPDPSEIVNDYSLPDDYLPLVSVTKGKREGTNIMELRQQIKEFSNATQTNLEIERAELMARNAELEEELISAQNYIDIYIKQKSVKPKK